MTTLLTEIGGIAPTPKKKKEKKEKGSRKPLNGGIENNYNSIIRIILSGKDLYLGAIIRK